MYHFQWQWTYTVIVIALLLALFVIAGAVLLLRHSPGRRWHRSPDSISTPLGLMSEHQANREWPWGTARAREREYHLKGRE